VPNLFIPEIEMYAEKDPLLYEILYQITSSIAKIPINSGAATPTPVQALDPTTGLPLTDASGNPLFTIPSTTSDPTNPLSSAQMPASENALYMQTDPTGQANALYMFAGAWQKIAKIIRTSDLSAKGAAAVTMLTKGAALLQGLQYDNQGRATSSFFTNAVDNTSFPSIQPLAQHGTTTQIDISAATWSFGGFQVSFNSGSVDPGAFGTYNVYYDDPQFNGGARTFFAVIAATGTVTSKRGRHFLGSITTAPGGGGTGNGGGVGGGGCGSPPTC
jgi:hypothetical protein